MQHKFKQAGSVVVFLGLISVTPALAQQTPAPREPGQTRAAQPAPVSGELISLDPQAKSLTIKTEAGNEMNFSYSETTEIVGAEKGLSGLVTVSGTRVTVHYSTHGTANTATKIEVIEKK